MCVSLSIIVCITVYHCLYHCLSLSVSMSINVCITVYQCLCQYLFYHTDDWYTQSFVCFVLQWEYMNFAEVAVEWFFQLFLVSSLDIISCKLVFIEAKLILPHNFSKDKGSRKIVKYKNKMTSYYTVCVRANNWNWVTKKQKIIIWYILHFFKNKNNIISIHLLYISCLHKWLSLTSKIKW